MANEVFNLDEDIAEYFEFTIKGHAYRMRYPSVEETDELRKNALDETKTRAFLFKFVTPIDPKTPHVSEFYKTLPINQWNKLIGLILDQLRS